MIRPLSIGLLLALGLLLMPVPGEKFWAHRCDSIEKFRLMSRKYAGLEIDATFYPNEPRGSKFDVSHDKKRSLDYPLENFMPIIAECGKPIWFDFKNLTAENAVAALEELDELSERNSIDRKKFIVESYDYESLKMFRERGYYTAYCVPTQASAYGEEIGRDREFVFRNPGMVEYFTRLVREAAESDCVDGITFPRTYYRLVKHTGVRQELLTWDTHGERWWDFYLREELREILFDDQVKVILVDAPTDFDR